MTRRVVLNLLPGMRRYMSLKRCGGMTLSYGSAGRLKGRELRKI